MIFQNNGKSSEVDMNDLEQKLRKAKRDIERDGSHQVSLFSEAGKALSAQ